MAPKKASTKVAKAGVQKKSPAKKAPVKKSAGKSPSKKPAAKSVKTSETKKDSKKEPKAKKAEPAGEVEKEADPSGIVIEACKQCNAFKTRALKIESLLKDGVEGVEVSINPVKPRRGYFEIRNGDTGEQYISLPSMQRPFPPLKALDIEELAEEIIGKLKEGKAES